MFRRGLSGAQRLRLSCFSAPLSFNIYTAIYTQSCHNSSSDRLQTGQALQVDNQQKKTSSGGYQEWGDDASLRSHSLSYDKLVEVLKDDPILWQKVQSAMVQNGGGGGGKSKVNLAAVRKSWPLLFIRTALPFFGFGVCDNIIMIFVGGEIDRHFGVVMGFSTMLAAGLGQAVSDGSGITIQQFIERKEHLLGIPSHGWTDEELRATDFGWVLQLFRTIGIVCGCFFGLIPVIMFDAGNEPRLHEKIFAHVDAERRKKISSHATNATFKKGDKVFCFDEEVDALYYVTQGECKIVARDDVGREIEICTQGVGVSLGYLEIVFNHRCVADVEVMSDTLQCKRIPKAVIDAVIGPPGTKARDEMVAVVKDFVMNESDLVAYRLRHPGLV